MELYRAILVAILSKQEVQVTFPDFKINPAEVVEGTCYQMLRRIQKIIKDCTLDDVECFQCIEAIVEEFEALNLDCGGRHDFG